MLETNPKLQPIDIKKILQLTATDIQQRNDIEKTIIGNGYDFDSGFGLINAEAAIDLAKNYEPSTPVDPTDKNPDNIVVNDPFQTGGGIFDLLSLFLLICCYGVSVYYQNQK